MSKYYRKQDTKLSQKDLADEYKTKWENDISQAQQLIDNTEKEEITFNSKKINPQISSVETLESFWFNGIIENLENKKHQFQKEIDNFQKTRVNWDANITYEKNNFVFYNGYNYLSLTENINKQPDQSPDTWIEFNLKGQVGYPELGITFIIGGWSLGVSYFKFDTIWYNDKLYTANTNITDTNTSPDLSSEWTLTMDLKEISIQYITSIASAPKENGAIFILGDILNDKVQFYQVSNENNIPLDLKTNMDYVEFDPSNIEYMLSSDNTMKKAIQRIITHFNLDVRGTQ